MHHSSNSPVAPCHASARLSSSNKPPFETLNPLAHPPTSPRALSSQACIPPQPSSAPPTTYVNEREDRDERRRNATSRSVGIIDSAFFTRASYTRALELRYCPADSSSRSGQSSMGFVRPASCHRRRIGSSACVLLVISGLGATQPLE